MSGLTTATYRWCVNARPADAPLNLNPSGSLLSLQLLLNAGDEFQGSLFFSFYGPTKIAETLNLLHFDAFTIGNHEFDRSDGVLAEFLGSLNAPAVSTNIKTTHHALAAQLVPFLVLPEHSLGIVALTTVDTPDISQPSNLTHFEPVINVQGTVDKLLDGRLGGKDASGTPLVKRVIALTHIGYEQDQLLAQSTRGISLIVGGHSHTPLGGEAWYSQGPYPTLRTNLDGEEVPIVTSYRCALDWSLCLRSLLTHNKTIPLSGGASISVASMSPSRPTQVVSTRILAASCA